MKHAITNILNEASRAPSVLNTQPWKFRVCGNTIEVYLEKKPELAGIDPFGRLQLASCGMLVSHLAEAVISNDWVPKFDFFPRFEEENLVAYVELSRNKKNGLPQHGSEPESTNHPDPDTCIKKIQKDLTSIATSAESELLVHDDGPDRKFQNYFTESCGRKLDSEYHRKNLNLLLRAHPVENDTIFEDEVLFSDRFFTKNHEPDPATPLPFDLENRFLILATKTDSRYNWIRAGDILGKMMIHLRNCDRVGLMALPVISSNCCRKWLREELNLSVFPQFVLKMLTVKPREHIRKRPLQELMKYGLL
ncbi:hypothetical protein QA596_08700 [Balneolales bacterium ANBcel1]|nr:hypothetical protein [Balneolales bacterium ANBcel1]